ncbi:trimeric G-protein alpha o subunit [Reticulomyxa filosa]|uniref:Trimeric G-protein alpha o subunit n=1 Tax=Reticulomyxa filosa TaxID=46433 RepID=X6NSS1_RETFI|nr:trimeric G-protein alpha o subunit [Reticulomyxa filosa]|eukprot:ETO29335.1 trimeric G-protein alpha o subunit [Reticulomyxa filosa]
MAISRAHSYVCLYHSLISDLDYSLLFKCFYQVSKTLRNNAKNLSNVGIACYLLKNYLFEKFQKMGSCCVQGADNLDVNAVINEKLGEAAQQEKRLIRIFLLGPGDSGKSTILKQLKKIYSNVDEKERVSYIASMQEVAYLKNQKSLNFAFFFWVGGEGGAHLPAYPEQAKEEFIQNQKTLELTEEMITKIETLWADKTLEYRSLYQIADNVPYFLDKVREIGTRGYVPSFEDYIRFRMRTTGYTSERFVTELKDKKFWLELTDVGGQRAERKKWLYLDTSSVNAILYIMAISEYDMMLFEADNVKRIDEAFDLFVGVMKKGFFVDKTCVIFFNKYEKIKSVPITVGFPDFPGDCDPHNPEIICEWLFARFKAVYDEHNKDPKSQLHYHCTTALDTNLIEKLLRNIQLDVIKSNLAMAGYF